MIFSCEKVLSLSQRVVYTAAPVAACNILIQHGITDCDCYNVASLLPRVSGTRWRQCGVFLVRLRLLLLLLVAASGLLRPSDEPLAADTATVGA